MPPSLRDVGGESPECEIYKARSPVEAGVAIRGARGTLGQTVTRAWGTISRPTSVPTPPGLYRVSSPRRSVSGDAWTTVTAPATASTATVGIDRDDGSRS